MRRVFVGLILALTTTVGLSPTRLRAQQGRPIVLLMHGRGMLGRDTAATRRDWLEAVQSGLSSLGVKSPLSVQDVRVVWYADVLDGMSNVGCDYANDDPRARREATEDPNFKSFIALAGSILNVVSSAVNDSAASLETRALASDAAFLTDARKRCAAEARLGDAIADAKQQGRPIILVAHSLGAVAAYDYLSSRRDSNVVQRFITLGSPLGSSIVRRILIGGDSTDVVSRLPSVRDWINIRHSSDDLAVPVAIARDTVISSPQDEPNPHELLGYLRDAATAREILNGWCGLFIGARPQGCIGLVSK